MIYKYHFYIILLKNAYRKKKYKNLFLKMNKLVLLLKINKKKKCILLFINIYNFLNKYEKILFLFNLF